MKASIKTIDIQTKEWFDKINGNSYFSSEITINYGLNTQKKLYVPFEYGYGSHSEDVCFQKIKKEINKNILKDYTRGLWSFCQDNKILFRSSKQENCLKRELLTEKDISQIN